ncbi:MAG TPA: DUF92 domain-containing protein, partial [bacterium]|nr:DUF92 domain-containing protein [bacterium]
MNQNIIGIIVSFAFVFAIILIATIIQKIFKLSNEFSRKIIHIGVGNWIFLALYYFSAWYYAVIGPAAFILINFLSYKYNIFKAMELEKKNPGTVYYSISLTICTLLSFSQTPALIYPFLGILAMTWGDGMAAVIGARFPIKQLRPGKSLGGFIAFFVFTSVSVLIYLLVYSSLPTADLIRITLVTALLGGLIEIFSRKNWDNLTVPL